VEEKVANKPTAITFKRGINRRGWESLHVIFSENDRTIQTFLIARDENGTLHRFKDADPERWEIATDPKDLHYFSMWFDQSDRLIADSIRLGDSGLSRT
jgi:hypothetical protein